MYSPFSEASEKPRALFASDARATQSPATPTHAARQRPRKSLVFMGITSVLVHFRSRSTRPSLPRVVGRGKEAPACSRDPGSGRGDERATRRHPYRAGAAHVARVSLVPSCATTASHAFNETAHPRPETPPRGLAFCSSRTTPTLRTAL